MRRSTSLWWRITQGNPQKINPLRAIPQFIYEFLTLKTIGRWSPPPLPWHSTGQSGWCLTQVTPRSSTTTLFSGFTVIPSALSLLFLSKHLPSGWASPSTSLFQGRKYTLNYPYIGLQVRITRRPVQWSGEFSSTGNPNLPLPALSQLFSNTECSLYPKFQPTFFLSEKQLFELGTPKFLHRLALFSYREFLISHQVSHWLQATWSRGLIRKWHPSWWESREWGFSCEKSFCPKPSPPNHIPAYLWNPRWRHSYEKCELIWIHGGRPAPVRQPDHFLHTTEW